MAALVLAAACAHGPRGGAVPGTEAPEGAPVPAPVPGTGRGAWVPGTEVGLASFYGRRFQGRRTASGERYDAQALTCAHPRAPFGTRLRVTELESGRSVVLKVNDRGPFVRDRVIDVSLAAARTLGFVHRGVVRVRVDPVPE